MFLNSGDCFSSNMIIDMCLEHIKKNPETDVFYGDILGINNISKKPWLHKHPSKLNLSFLKNKI